MERFLTRSWAGVFSGLFTNLAAGWLAAAFITPNFSDWAKLEDKLVLTGDIFFAIVSLFIANWFEKRKEKL